MRRLLLALLVLVAACESAQAAPAFVNSNGNNDNTSGTTILITLGSIGGGNLLVACGYWNGTVETAAISDDAANTWVAIDSMLTAFSGRLMQCFYAKNIAASGNVSVTLTTSATTTRRGMAVMQYSGLSSAAPLDAHDSSKTGSNSSPTSNTITTTGANDVGVGFVVGQNITETAGSGWTLREGTNISGNMTEDKFQTPGSMQATSGVTETGSWGFIIVSFSDTAITTSGVRHRAISQ